MAKFFSVGPLWRKNIVRLWLECGLEYANEKHTLFLKLLSNFLSPGNCRLLAYLSDKPPWVGPTLTRDALCVRVCVGTTPPGWLGMGWLLFPRGNTLRVFVPGPDGLPSRLAAFVKPLTRRAPRVGFGGVFPLLWEGHSPPLPGGRPS